MSVYIELESEHFSPMGTYGLQTLIPQPLAAAELLPVKGSNTGADRVLIPVAYTPLPGQPKGANGSLAAKRRGPWSLAGSSYIQQQDTKFEGLVFHRQDGSFSEFVIWRRAV